MILYYTNGTTHHAEYTSLEIRYFESYAPSPSAALNIQFCIVPVFMIKDTVEVAQQPVMVDSSEFIYSWR
jgi:hypothetical protein